MYPPTRINTNIQTHIHIQSRFIDIAKKASTSSGKTPQQWVLRSILEGEDRSKLIEWDQHLHIKLLGVLSVVLSLIFVHGDGLSDGILF